MLVYNNDYWSLFHHDDWLLLHHDDRLLFHHDDRLLFHHDDLFRMLVMLAMVMCRGWHGKGKG